MASIYIAIAAGMLATIVATAVIAIAGGFSHLTIWTEVALIGLFAEVLDDRLVILGRRRQRQGHRGDRRGRVEGRTDVIHAMDLREKKYGSQYEEAKPWRL